MAPFIYPLLLPPLSSSLSPLLPSLTPPPTPPRSTPPLSHDVGNIKLMWTSVGPEQSVAISPRGTAP